MGLINKIIGKRGNLDARKRLIGELSIEDCTQLKDFLFLSFIFDIEKKLKRVSSETQKLISVDFKCHTS